MCEARKPLNEESVGRKQAHVGVCMCLTAALRVEVCETRGAKSVRRRGRRRERGSIFVVFFSRCVDRVVRFAAVVIVVVVLNDDVAVRV